MSVLELLGIGLSVVALLGAGTAVVLALQRPQWIRDQDRRILMLETEWEEVLDKIKKRGDRLSRERGLLSKKEEQLPLPVSTDSRRSQLWAMKRNKEINRA